MTKYLLTSDGCPHCKKAKEKFKDQIAKGDIEELSVTQEQGYGLAEKLGIQAIPALVECKENKCKILDLNK